jgi:uncharacterized protein
MLLAAGLGALVGFILALTGAGGAILAVPMLVFAFQWDVAQAAPVALFAVAVSATVGTIMGLRSRIVRYRAALLMAAIGSALAPMGVLVAQHLPNRLLTLIFVAVLLLIAWRMFRPALAEWRGQAVAVRVQDAAACRLSAETGRFRWTAHCTRVLSQAGAITGLLSGLLGVGGGFVLVPALRRATDLPLNAIVATSLMVMALVASSAVITAVAAGRLDLTVALPFAGGAVVSMWLGRQVAARLAGPRLQMGFALLATAVAASMVISLLH